ncbi:MAG: hypothetical protein Q8904_09855, partial [Bacteroidota bacterium]|nr:hypothetical protein [Bacteroidota bacterium]
MPVSKNMFSGLRFLKIALLLLFTLVNLTAISQNVNDKTEIVKLMAAVDTFRNNVPAEKIYLHLDKPYYITGDTLWFKIYLFEANFYTASLKSGICYLEIANDQNKLVKRMMLPVVGGLSWGNIALDEKQFTEGGYIVRVYTNLMRNWSEEYIYQRQINIYSPSSLPAFDNSVLKGKENTHTGDKSTETKRGQKIYQPGVTTNIDLQFMPEGGDLVNEISTTIGFKAIGEDGKGIHVEGKIYNNKQQEVASFKSLHKGMGTFELTPHNNESYTAKISLPENVTKKYPLPLAHSKGIVMNIINHSSTDSLKVILKATPEIEKQNNSYYLIGQSRGVICFAKMVHFKDTTYFCQLSKTIFPGGITHIVLLNTSMSPVNERIVFIDHHDNLKINIASDKTTYTPRDSVAVHLTVTDKEGKPVQGSFSLSVTDNTQVASDALYPSNITTHLWLTSELKGTVEDPAYYFQTSDDSSPVQQIDTISMALDNLLLTQGWVAYPWEQVFSQKAPEYQAEPEFMIKGKASNSFKGIPNTRVLLFTKHPFLMIDTLTDKEGRFTFKNLHLRDTASYLIQSLNRRGRSFLNTVSVDEFKPPVFADRHIV